MPIPLWTTAAELQDAADDVGTLADMVSDISNLLDKIANKYDVRVIEAVNSAWEPAKSIRSNGNRKLLRYVASISPPEY